MFRAQRPSMDGRAGGKAAGPRNARGAMSSTLHVPAIPGDRPESGVKAPMRNRPRPDLPGERREIVARRRLFVAAGLDDATRATCAIAAQRLRATGWTGRWVDPANYHVTVAFLGSVDEDLVDDVLGVLRSVVPQLRALDVPLDALGGFPNARRARVAWLGPSEPIAEFTELCRLVRVALSELELPIDQHAEPHVTLARAVGLAGELPWIEPPPATLLRVDALTLCASVTAPGGARYDALEWMPLPGVEDDAANPSA